MKKITISMIILLFLLTSCLPNLHPPKTFAIRGDFFVTETTAKGNSYYKQKCDVQIDYGQIKLSSIDYDLDIKMDYYYLYRQGIGYDKKGKEWDVIVYNPARRLYLLTLTSDSVQLTIGFKYYR